ncbi:hypothetical protein OH491_20825 [Termitidicoccus mucosus]
MITAALENLLNEKNRHFTHAGAPRHGLISIAPPPMACPRAVVIRVQQEVMPPLSSFLFIFLFRQEQAERKIKRKEERERFRR